MDAYSTQLLSQQSIKAAILSQLSQPPEVTVALQYYTYVSELDSLQSGTYIRWIDATNTLQKGAIYCNITINDETSAIFCVCRGFNNRYYSIPFNECYLFQKMSNDDILTQRALDYIAGEVGV